jgi:hypothetical protein
MVSFSYLLVVAWQTHMKRIFFCTNIFLFDLDSNHKLILKPIVYEEIINVMKTRPLEQKCNEQDILLVLRKVWSVGLALSIRNLDHWYIHVLDISYIELQVIQSTFQSLYSVQVLHV